MTRSQFFNNLYNANANVWEATQKVSDGVCPEGMPLSEAWRIYQEMIKFQNAAIRLGVNLKKIEENGYAR